MWHTLGAARSPKWGRALLVSTSQVNGSVPEIALTTLGQRIAPGLNLNLNRGEGGRRKMTFSFSVGFVIWIFSPRSVAENLTFYTLFPLNIAIKTDIQDSITCCSYNSAYTCEICVCTLHFLGFFLWKAHVDNFNTMQMHLQLIFGSTETWGIVSFYSTAAFWV